MASKVAKAGIHITGKATHFASKFGGPAAKKALKTALHAPAIYSKINDAFGGKLDILIVMGTSTAGGLIGDAVGVEFGGVGELITGPVGGFAGGALGKMAVGLLHSQDGMVTQKDYEEMPPEQQEGYNAMLEENKISIAEKAKEIFLGLSDEKKEEVSKMTPQEQNEFLAEQIKKKEGSSKFHIDEDEVLGKTDSHKKNSHNKSKGGSHNKKGSGKHQKKGKDGHKKHHHRLLGEKKETEEKSPFKHPALDIAYRLAKACKEDNGTYSSWF